MVLASLDVLKPLVILFKSAACVAVTSRNIYRKPIDLGGIW